ncbi:MAG: KEOPS complex subunit Pcc1 [Candidatus Bathyarchaeia archaeon]
MKANASMRLKFNSEKILDTIFRALEPEAKKPATMRSRASLERDGTFLILKVEAKDTVALRAALNAYLRWINSIVNVLEVLKAQ